MANALDLHSGRLGSSPTVSTKRKYIIMDKEKAIKAITEWFKANYEINIDYSTMIINIKRVKV